MLRRILLLCEEVERPFLTEGLTAHGKDLDVLHLPDAAALQAVKPALLGTARLIAFSSGIIVPAEALDALGHGAYNFHPGPPDYPGWMPAAFAAYDGVREFGATAHAMSAKVDGGAIVGVKTFACEPGTSRAELARGAYLALLALFRVLAPALASLPTPLPTIDASWGPRKTTRALFASYCDVQPDIDRAELVRRLRGFGEGDGRSRPTVWLHGVPFRYAPD